MALLINKMFSEHISHLERLGFKVLKCNELSTNTYAIYVRGRFKGLTSHEELALSYTIHRRYKIIIVRKCLGFYIWEHLVQGMGGI